MPVKVCEDRWIEPTVSDATLARMNVLLGGPWQSARNVRVFAGGHLYSVTIDEYGNATIEPSEAQPSPAPAAD